MNQNISKESSKGGIKDGIRGALQKAFFCGVAGMTVMAASAPAHAFNPRDTSVQMFHWKWTDIAKECSNFLGPQGYGGVQISPPSSANRGSNWWDIYQPVDYTNLTSKMGTGAELQSMINTCHAAGVRVYADIVVNHLAAGSGTSTAGANWVAASSYPRFSAADFHPACDIQGSDYSNNRNAVTQCRLVGLPDLDTGASYVQGQIRNYLSSLIGMGIDGFRFDAAKHIRQSDLQTIVNGVTHTTTAGEPLWITQEIITDGTVDRNSYLSIGTINEFKYATAMKETFRNLNGASISQMRSIMGTPGNWGGTWGFFTDSSKATVFINNWDTERNGDSMNASNRSGATNDTQGSKRYGLANIFMLAWPYGEAQVHSGFIFTDTNADAPAASPFDANGNPLINQQWDFIHRWADIANMVAFRAVTSGQGVDNFTSGSANQIAFNRGSKGFVAINNEFSAWNQSFQTLLPAGTYCNVVHGVANAGKTACTADAVVVAANGMVTLSIPANGGSTVPAVALHINQKLGSASNDTTAPSVPTGLAATAASSSSINVSWNAATDNAGGSGVKGYNIARNGGSPVFSASTSFADSGLSPATTYSYTVAAVDNANNVSASSIAASAKTLAGACQVQVNFQVTNNTTVVGQDVYLTGNGAELGNWNTASATKLSGNLWPLWTVSRNLNASTTYEYKYLTQGVKPLAWEVGANRVINVPACGSGPVTVPASAFRQ
jgi:alpha-amylase